MRFGTLVLLLGMAALLAVGLAGRHDRQRQPKKHRHSSPPRTTHRAHRPSASTMKETTDTTTIHPSAPRSDPPPKEWSFNSGSIQVWHDDLLWYEHYVGKRSHEYDAKFDFNSQFRICSNSKLFTAVATLQLVEDGFISSIHDDIADYLDTSDLEAWGFPAGTERLCPTLVNDTTGECQKVTFLSLMSMSSGLMAVLTCPYAPSDWQHSYCPSIDHLIFYPGSFAATIALFIQNPLQSVPGPTYGPDPSSPNSYFYANENFIILSYFVEKYSGMNLGDYFQQYIFDPVGLDLTVYDPWNQAFQLLPFPSSEYYYYTDVTQSHEPFAIASCASTETSPGVQAGSGGVVSTLPDMAKWYTSLFVKRNTTILTSASIDQIIYPWSMEPYQNGSGYPIQYYGLGVEVIFANPPMSPPAVADQPTGIFYMGASVCSFLTIFFYNGTTDFFTGKELKTTPIMVVAARNNHILNVTETEWDAVQRSTTGTWFELSGYPTGWGQTLSVFADTTQIALRTAFHFAEKELPAQHETGGDKSENQNQNHNKNKSENGGDVV